MGTIVTHTTKVKWLGACQMAFPIDHYRSHLQKGFFFFLNQKMISNKSKDEEMTTAEREQWLRERGVQIEDFKSKPQEGQPRNGNILEQMAGLIMNEETIPFVCIPQDESKPIFNLKLPKSFTEKPGDVLPNYVKPYFASDRKSIDATLLKEQVTQHFVGGDLANFDDTNISTAAMNSAAALGSVETFPLVRPADTNGYQGTSRYIVSTS
jgi:hypothetical protein